jgi:hypothetical protein
MRSSSVAALKRALNFHRASEADDRRAVAPITRLQRPRSDEGLARSAVVNAYVDDPLNHDLVTPRLVRFILDSATSSALARNSGACRRSPVGRRRSLVDANGSREFGKQCAEGPHHDARVSRAVSRIFNENEPAVFETMLHWLAVTW